MTTSNSSIDPWELRERNMAAPLKKGPYDSQRTQLFSLLAEAKKHSLLTKLPNGFDNFVCKAFVHDADVNIGIRVNFHTEALRVGIKVAKSQEEARYFDLTSSGDAVNVEGNNIDQERWPYLNAGISRALRELRGRIDGEVKRKLKRRRKAKKVITITSVIAAALTLIGLGVVFLGIKPLEAANRARADYDAAGYQLQSPGYLVDMHPLGNLPDGSLQRIPDLWGSDKVLTSPRKVDINYSSSDNWCKSMSVNIPPENIVVVAVEEGSPFHRDRYSTTYAGNKFTVCLIDGFSATYEAHQVKVQLALQVKPQGATK